MAQKADTVERSYVPTGVRFGVDMISIIRTPIEPKFSGWEAAADIDFDRYYLVLEAGRWSRDLSSENDTYSNRGNFWRAGVDMNFLKNDPERNNFFLGLRYARGSFSEQLITRVNDPVFGEGIIQNENIDVGASWAELTTGLRVRMFSVLWMGYTIRYKFGLNTNESSGLVPYDVPGYGRTDKNTTWGFTYYVLVRVPFKGVKK
ncbi:MAG: hypothetical protein KF725_16075 [Cyclobacteriaceae bacterium]|nr:hypothetical protein [Cyclobacteriaceae bacterium]UYN87232.1 MAG: hypothetical protein KIT51_02850 [Cyclobacteriaceae bacterium]